MPESARNAAVPFWTASIDLDDQGRGSLNSPGKVERSGLREHFLPSRLVAEKNAATYREVVSQYALPPDSTWMIETVPSVAVGHEYGLEACRKRGIDVGLGDCFQSST